MAEEPFINDSQPPEEAQNRTFIILAIALGGVFLVGLLCIGVYILFIGPRQQEARLAAAAAVMTQNAQIALDATAAAMPTNTPTIDAGATALALAQTATAAVTPTSVVLPPTNTLVPTATLPPTDTPGTAPDVSPTPSPTGPTPTGGPTRSPTPTPLVGGLQPTRTGTPTQLPSTGFADEVGMPGLVILGLALVAVVIIARRLRLSLR